MVNGIPTYVVLLSTKIKDNLSLYICILVYIIVQYYDVLTSTVPNTDRETNIYTIDREYILTTSYALGG